MAKFSAPRTRGALRSRFSSHLWKTVNVALLAAVIGLLVSVAGLWLHAENRVRVGERQIIELASEVSELQRENADLRSGQERRNKGEARVETAPRANSSDGPSASSAHLDERAIQFYITDSSGGVVAGATVTALRTREKVAAKASGLTDKLKLRQWDTVSLKKEGYQPCEIVINSERFESGLVEVQLRRIDHVDGK